MVKLVFDPKNSTENEVVESLTSKKREINLNPFRFNESVIPETQPTEELKLKDLIGLENCAYVLNEWYNNSKKVLLIVGPVGCGKTTLVELYCKENSIHLYNVRSSDTIKTKKELLKDIISFSQYSSTSFFKKESCKKLILIDEYQNGQGDLLSITDINNLLLLRTKEENKKELSSFLNGVCDFNTQITLPSILIISSDSKGSKLSDIKKTQEVYYINEIPFNTIKQWVNTLYDIDSELLTEIIKKCKSDKRLILNTLEFLNQNTEADPITFIESFYKDIDINIFDCINLLFDTSFLSINDIFKIYDTDGFLLSNMVFENYLDYSNDIHKVAKASEAISFGETVFSDTYESNKTFIPDAHCVNSLCIPRHYLQSDIPNKNLRTCCINNRYNIYLNNKKILTKINENKTSKLSLFDVFDIKMFLNQSLIKTKTLNALQEKYLKGILLSLNNSPEKLELIYKHFSDFSGKETKTKNFTLKFKEKIKKLN